MLGVCDTSPGLQGLFVHDVMGDEQSLSCLRSYQRHVNVTSMSHIRLKRLLCPSVSSCCKQRHVAASHCIAFIFEQHYIITIIHTTAGDRLVSPEGFQRCPAAHQLPPASVLCQADSAAVSNPSQEMSSERASWATLMSLPLQPKRQG